MGLFKDESRITQENTEAQEKGFKEIATLLKHSLNQPKILKDTLLGNEQYKTDEHIPNHESCSSIGEKDKTKLTEKRICRCMNYFEEKSKKCQNCFLEKKWKNIGKLQVIEYEWPTDKVMEEVGGMDLIIQDGDKQYGLEVKPPIGNNEPLTRMFAETLTYTLDCKKGYLPGICFFENSKQMEYYLDFKDNEDFKYITGFIPVYLIRIIRDGPVCEYEIKRIV